MNASFTNDKGLAKVALIASFLGILLGLHISLLIYTISVQFSVILFQWSLYFSCLLLFHLGEFFFAALCQPSEISTHAFLIDHSRSYQIAALASWVEFWLEALFIPSIKSNYAIVLTGLFLVVSGNSIRNLAMWTCRTNFNLNIEHNKRPDHVLVTHGIYSYVRHPAYFGWFYWSIGTQLLLTNPLCTIAYAIASWQFFNNRIPYEEMTLRGMFGEKWDDFKKRTPTGIPFIP